jgi:hypothetical protein
MEEMERVRRCKRPCQLGIERAPARQPDDVAEPAEAGVSAAGNGCWVPPPAHELTLRRQPDAADNAPMRVLLILLIPVMLFSAWQFTRREENENRLALVASAVASRDVEVSCPGVLARLVEITPNSGWVDFDQDGKPGDTTILSASTCRGLERVWRGDEKSFACLLGGGCDENTMGAVYGIVTLAHESWHLRGVTGESETQCYAIQTVEQVALRLGVSSPNAHLIALWVALDNAAAPAGEYHSPECHPGGRYDRHPETPDWPSA